MRISRLCPFVLAPVLLAAVPRPAAAACSDGPCFDFGGLIVVGGIYALGTINFTLHDIAIRDSSKAYGVVETFFNLPFAAIFARDFVDGVGGDTGAGTLFLIGGLATLHTALTVHGVHTLVRDRRRPTPTPPPPPAQISLGGIHATFAPTAVSDGRLVAPGLGLAGSF